MICMKCGKLVIEHDLDGRAVLGPKGPVCRNPALLVPIAQLERVLDSESRGSGSEPRWEHHALVAQGIEHTVPTGGVARSIRAKGT